jgi:23S rRNA (guanine745-N1)-methyltransferase
MTSILLCPVCSGPLVRTATSCLCSNKHTFDIARQGYINFHLAHQKHSREPGDSPEMIESRRRFLDLGLYDRVSDCINETVSNLVREARQSSTLNILDAGCGEGFYLKRLKDALAGLRTGHPSIDYYGVDISKAAVRKATQRDRTINWLVASNINLPFMPSSFDVILNIFSPADFSEFSRVLNKNGRLVIVSPGPKHLNGLREVIYPVAREHARSAKAEQAGGIFSPATAARVNYHVELSNHGAIMDLLAMTPYFWHIDLKTKSKVELLDLLTLDVDVNIRVFKKAAEVNLTP